jgi:hypothetical protein
MAVILRTKATSRITIPLPMYALKTDLIVV